MYVVTKNIPEPKTTDILPKKIIIKDVYLKLTLNVIVMNKNLFIKSKMLKAWLTYVFVLEYKFKFFSQLPKLAVATKM